MGPNSPRKGVQLPRFRPMSTVGKRSPISGLSHCWPLVVTGDAAISTCTCKLQCSITGFLLCYGVFQLFIPGHLWAVHYMPTSFQFWSSLTTRLEDRQHAHGLQQKKSWGVYGSIYFTFDHIYTEYITRKLPLNYTNSVIQTSAFNLQALKSKTTTYNNIRSLYFALTAIHTLLVYLLKLTNCGHVIRMEFFLRLQRCYRFLLFGCFYVVLVCGSLCLTITRLSLVTETQPNHHSNTSSNPDPSRHGRSSPPTVRW